MQRIIVSLGTLLCVLAGWLLAGNRRPLPREIVASVSTPRPVEAAVLNAAPKARDASDIVARVVAKFSAEHQSSEVSAELFAELQDLPAEDFGSVIAILVSTKNWENARLLAGYWAERDLPAARDWALGLPDGNFTGAVFDTWGFRDFPGMCDWLEAHPDALVSESHRDAAGFSLAKAAGRNDPERGLHLLKVLKGGHAWNLFNVWAKREPLAAANRALQVPDERVRRDGIYAVSSEWGPVDPAGARAWAETIPDPIVSKDTVVYIGSALGWKDAAAGAAYLAQIPQSNEARKALRDTVSNWAERDPDSAFRWAADLADAGLGDWVAAEVKAKAPPEQRAKMEERWSGLRAAKSTTSQPAR